MENGSHQLKALLVAEGSGGHLVPALEAARTLARQGLAVSVWYARRRRAAPVAEALTQEAREASVDVEAILGPSSSGLFGRVWQGVGLWRKAQRCFGGWAPDVVVGFGGWVSAPVVLAARTRRIGCVLHEQNVIMGRTNRWLSRWVDRIAVSFNDTQAQLDGRRFVVTGLPVRGRIGGISRVQAAAPSGLAPDRPTLLVLGGSQGSRALNRLMAGVAALLSSEERRTWQIVHLTGASDEAAMADAYATHRITALVRPFCVEMEALYAQADVVISRAGASTIAELARCGIPAILIPYPFAGAHQRANAQLVETVGDGLMIDESDASPERVLAAARRILTDERLRTMMGSQVRHLYCPDAAGRLAEVIVEVAQVSARRCVRPTPMLSEGRCMALSAAHLSGVAH